MIEWLLRSRPLVVAAYLVVLGLAIWSALGLQIDPNNRVFFGPNDQRFQQLVDLEHSFGSNTNLFFVVRSKDSIFEDRNLAEAIRWLSDEAWKVDHVVAVDSVSTYPYVTDDGESFVVWNLLDYICPEGETCQKQRAAALKKPYLTNRFVSPDARSFAVVAKVDLSSPTADQVSRVSGAADALVDRFEGRFPALSVYLTGGVPMMDAFVDAAENDSGSLIVILIVVLSLGMYLFLGGIVPTILMLLLGISAVIVTLGVAGMFGFVINTATATVPLIVFTLVVAAAMHLFLHIVREERLDSREAVQRATVTAVRAHWRPIAMTAATTAIGLLSMVFVSAPPLMELGVLSAIGVVVGAILTLVVVPCVFAMLRRVRSSNYLLWVQEGMNRYARWIEHKRPRMAFVLLAFGFALVGTANVNVDEDFVRYFAEGTKFREDTESITGLMAGPYHLDVVYDSGEPAGIYSEKAIRDLRDLSQYLRRQPEVVNVASVLDVLREVAAAMTEEASLLGRPADELAQYFLSYELSLGIGQSTKDLLDSAHRNARISVLLGDVSMSEIRHLAERIEQWAEGHGAEERMIVTGEGIPTAYLSSESIREMTVGIGISVLLSAGLVGWYFRSGRACASILAATAIPILAGFGVWGWIESDIGMAATLVVATTIGVVIDDTIHLTYRYVDSLRHLDLTPWGATAYSIHKAGTAIFVTSTILVAGLMVLIFSDFRMNSTFGVCSSLIIALALVYNLTLAPRFLRHLR